MTGFRVGAGTTMRNKVKTEQCFWCLENAPKRTMLTIDGERVCAECWEYTSATERKFILDLPEVTV